MGIEPKPLKPVASDENIQAIAEHFLKPNFLRDLKKNRLLENYLNTPVSKKISTYSTNERLFL